VLISAVLVHLGPCDIHLLACVPDTIQTTLAFAIKVWDPGQCERLPAYGDTSPGSAFGRREVFLINNVDVCVWIRMDSDSDGFGWIRMDSDADADGFGCGCGWIRMRMDSYGFVWMSMDEYGCG
jgi:hypothetical protein